MLYIYNSLSGQKEVFKPIHPGKISIYVCGMTVYDYCHIGHARTMLVFDMITRYLRARGYEVHYVRNITDIDDKIIHRAQQQQEPYQTLTERFITALHEDEQQLGIIPPQQQPRATLAIPAMIDLINELLAKKYAYIGSSGDVYYDISQFPQYGKLSKQDLEHLRAGARVAVTDAKADPLDFVLWKLAKPGEPSWESPWGAGRPGWHIECSAMSLHCLGKHFDIHGGGLDLLFPHHENEIAQSEAANQTHFVNTWIHVGYLQINQEKMSKSLGNFLTIREVLAEHPAEVIRYFMAASHYRSPLNYSAQALQQAHQALERLYTALRDLPPTAAPTDSPYTQHFQQAMDDDFNTPEALAVLFNLAHDINRLRVNHPAEAATQASLLKQLAQQLGLLQQSPETFLQSSTTALDINAIEQQITARQMAREQKNWAEADRIRNELAAQNIMLEDKNGQTTWRYERNH